MIKAIITDIEGTTTSLSFVKDVLFPYARARIQHYVIEHWQDAALQEQIAAMEIITGDKLDAQRAGQLLVQWIDEDKKIAPLKALQGIIWEAGYRDGDYKGHVYDDAHEYLRRWHDQGIKLYIYSSGSVYAQKLLFGFSDFGDLTPLFSGYFDTAVGAKIEQNSYANILKTIDLPADQVLFLSDIGAELDAAAANGIQTCQLIRDGQATPAPGHRHAPNFHGIIL